jgi:hypothetical protein
VQSAASATELARPRPLSAIPADVIRLNRMPRGP